MKADGTRKARSRWVIETVALRGDGAADPIREVTQFWTNEGRLLAEHDSMRTTEQWDIVMERGLWGSQIHAAIESVIQNAEAICGDDLDNDAPIGGLEPLLDSLRQLKRLAKGEAA